MTVQRYAQAIGKQLGQLDPLASPSGECPPGWPDEIPCMLPPSSTGGLPMPLITEEEAAKRELEAFERGRAQEQSSLIKTAALTAAVSAVVGIAIGKLLG